MATMSTNDFSKVRWRIGRSVGRTIYAQVGAVPSDDDVLLGLMDTLDLAYEAVEAHNHCLAEDQGAFR